MKILIVARVFPPENHISAVRPGMFSRYLVEMGHDVTVICTPAADADGIQNTDARIQVIRVPQSDAFLLLQKWVTGRVEARPQIGQILKYQKLRNEKVGMSNYKALLRWGKNHSYHILRELDWSRQVQRRVVCLYGRHAFDMVYTTFPPLGAMLVGFALKRRAIGKCWLSDMRDHLLDDLFPNFANRIYTWLCKKMIQECDWGIAISHGQKAIFERDTQPISSREKLAVISNGYVSNSTHFAEDNRVLDIAYLGSLYGGYRDLSMLFAAIHDLLRERRIESTRVRFHYAGGQGLVAKAQAEQFGMGDILVDHGYLDRERVFALQGLADALVVLSWNTQTEEGIIPGKYFEYFPFRKPIISLCSGDRPQAEITQMTEEYRLGIACEYATQSTDLVRLKAFLVEVYTRALAGKTGPWPCDMEAIERHAYPALTSRLLALVDSPSVSGPSPD